MVMMKTAAFETIAPTRLTGKDIIMAIKEATGHTITANKASQVVKNIYVSTRNSTLHHLY
jgi:hypothetical protein